MKVEPSRPELVPLLEEGRELASFFSPCEDMGIQQSATRKTTSPESYHADTLLSDF